MQCRSSHTDCLTNLVGVVMLLGLMMTHGHAIASNWPTVEFRFTGACADRAGSGNPNWQARHLG